MNIGSTLRIHLAFEPTSLSARILPAKRFSTLKPGRVASWPVKKLGVLEVQARASKGSASYVIDLRR